MDAGNGGPGVETEAEPVGVEMIVPFFKRAGALRRRLIHTVQVNVGKVCNQACHHCHVSAGPKRTESMTRPTANRILDLLKTSSSARVLDITGGAPEMCPSFRHLVASARALDLRVLDRCNLTVLLLDDQLDTARFLAANSVDITASLPCYTSNNVDMQRGRGVFDRSIQALRLLNTAGYGMPGSPLVLDLVYNPGGPFLPPPQAGLEADYRSRLLDLGVTFSRLLTITNMPIERFDRNLRRAGQRTDYMRLLCDSYNPATLDRVMCLNQVSVGWDGRLYDCDFNQMLGMEVRSGRTLWDLESFDQLDDEAIGVADHCYGCTAGAGSSCGGTLAIGN